MAGGGAGCFRVGEGGGGEKLWGEMGEKSRSSEVYRVSMGVVYLFMIGMYLVIYLYILKNKSK